LTFFSFFEMGEKLGRLKDREAKIPISLSIIKDNFEKVNTKVVHFENCLSIFIVKSKLQK